MYDWGAMRGMLGILDEKGLGGANPGDGKGDCFSKLQDIEPNVGRGENDGIGGADVGDKLPREADNMLTGWC